MIVSVILPLLALRAALGEAQDRLLKPIALAPQHDAPQLVGEVSEIAHELGIRAGMGLGEAIDICPQLSLVTPDPSRAEQIWQLVLTRLEATGAEVESKRGGEAFFDADPIERLHGNVEGVLDIVLRRLGGSVRIGVAATRLAAHAAARQSDAGDQVRIVPPDRLNEFLESLPIAILIGRLGGSETGTRRMLISMRKLGIRRLGEITALSADAVADRFGPLGIEARNAALGLENGLHPRTPTEAIAESIDLPEVASGIHLRGAMSILCDRIAKRVGDLGLTVRRLATEANLAGGGSWVRDATPRQPTARAEILRLILLPGLEHLPRPAEKLKLRVTDLGPGGAEQIELTHEPDQTRYQRLEEAARQVRVAVGEGGLMRVLDAELGSHLPERRMLLAPYLSEERGAS